MFRRIAHLGTLLIAPIAVLSMAAVAAACPFCNAVSMTLTEEMKQADAVVIADLIGPVDPDATPDSPDSGKVLFKVTDTVRGESPGGDTGQIEVLYFGQMKPDSKFLITGIEDRAGMAWATPIPLSERAVGYVKQLLALPESGADRLAFFQEHFEDEDDMLARDAYDEFARAPYQDVKDLKDRMHHEKLVAWIQDREVPATRRRLYLTMLGVCGSETDAEMLEEMIRSDDREMKTALDAIVACYLTLSGPDGMPLVEERFLKNAEAEYTDTYAAIMALRFHGQEESIIPRERLLEGMRYMLDRPELADLVIPDLARWEDWSVVDRLVTLFKDADEESSWVRVPVINYLRACPEPEAKERIDELAEIDPDAVKRANSFFPLAAAAPAPAPAPGNSEPDSSTAAAEPTDSLEDGLVATTGSDSADSQGADASEDLADDAEPAAVAATDEGTTDGSVAEASAGVSSGEGGRDEGERSVRAAYNGGVLIGAAVVLALIFVVMMIMLRGSKGRVPA